MRGTEAMQGLNGQTSSLCSRRNADRTGGGFCVPFAVLLLGLLLAAPVWAQPVPIKEIRSIAGGGSHTCASLQRGGVRCWGFNGFAQLGDGTRIDRLLPVRTEGLSGPIQALAAGEIHSCAILADGTVRCWGMNFYGQLGNGSTDLGFVPVTPLGLGTGVRQIGAGENHSCALTAAGGVKCWGANYSGQLGDGTFTDRLQAVDVQGLSSGVRSIAVGHRHSCAVTDAGAVKCWGFNFAGQLGNNSDQDSATPVDAVGLSSGIAQVAAGLRHTCALSDSGAVSCWGDNSSLQLGNDADENGLRVPTPVIGLSLPAISVRLGGDHSCALLQGGEVMCWGRNDLGQLGDGSIVRSRRPVRVIGMRPGVRSITLGMHHGCARQADDSLRCWGLNFNGQLGNGNTTQSFIPQVTQSLPGPAQTVDVGEEHSCALGADGAVACWGLNLFAQLGDGSTVQRLLPGPVLDLSGISAIDVGGFHGCGLRNGAALCWGHNDVGQLGDGSGGDQTRPVAVQGMADSVQSISAGGVHTCAVRNGGLRCWGHNFAGQLGDGSLERRFSPVDVMGLGSGVRSVATSFNAHTCAITLAGGLKCWGANDRGQLGDGSTLNRSTPVDVSGLASGVQSVSLGGEHGCALLSGGRVKCWGSNDNFQLGNDSGAQAQTAIDVAGLSDVTALALGRSHSCALTGPGEVLCWGRNDAGQLGDGSSLQRADPTRVAGLRRGVRAIASGAEHSCAVLANGAIKCWGSNYSGQFGDGKFGGRPVPVEVRIDRDSRLRAVPSNDAAIKAPSSNASGRFLAFESSAAGLVPGDNNNSRDVFRVDTHSGQLQRVSLDNAGAEVGADSGQPAISADGQRVLFVAPQAAVKALFGESSKRRAERQKGGGSGIFLRNMQTGSTTLVGTASGSDVAAPQLAANGQSVVFTSSVTDPAIGPVGTQQVFLQSVDGFGMPTSTPRCVSCKVVASNGSDSGVDSDGEGTAPVVSADGQWVAWQSTAKTTVAGKGASCPDASSQVLLRNMQTGAVQTASVPASGGSCGGGSGSTQPSIDYAATALAFQSDQPLAEGDDNSFDDVYLFQIGNAALTRLSETPGGVGGNAASVNPSISGDGATVAFSSEARNLVLGEADNNETTDVLAWNSSNDSLSRVSTNVLGDQADAASDQPVLNFAGSLVAFESDATNLLLGSVGAVDTNGVTDLFQTVNPLAATPLKSATWWKESEAGWGLFIFDQGNLLAPAWFTYDSDGEPTWFLASGAFQQEDGSYVGDLFRFTGVPLAQINGPASDPPSQVGSLSLRFIGEQGLQFDYSVDGVVQSKSMTRFPFGSRSLTCRASADPTRRNASNYSDVWWGGEASSGWGLFLNHVDDALFAVWYTYDTDREAVFLVISTTRQVDGSFTGEVFRQANGTPFSMIDNAAPSASAAAIGSATFRFSDGNSGEFSYSLAGVNQSKSISRLQVGDLATACETTTSLE